MNVEIRLNGELVVRVIHHGVVVGTLRWALGVLLLDWGVTDACPHVDPLVLSSIRHQTSLLIDTRLLNNAAIHSLMVFSCVNRTDVRAEIRQSVSI